jgi:hypothetical protein
VVAEMGDEPGGSNGSIRKNRLAGGG